MWNEIASIPLLLIPLHHPFIYPNPKLYNWVDSIHIIMFRAYCVYFVENTKLLPQILLSFSVSLSSACRMAVVTATFCCRNFSNTSAIYEETQKE